MYAPLSPRLPKFFNLAILLPSTSVSTLKQLFERKLFSLLDEGDSSTQKFFVPSVLKEIYSLQVRRYRRGGGWHVGCETPLVEKFHCKWDLEPPPPPLPPFDHNS